MRSVPRSAVSHTKCSRGNLELPLLNALELTAGSLIAIITFVTAAYFIWRQGATLQVLRFSPHLPLDQRRYLAKQCWRRVFGSLVLALLAVLLFGSLFLDYEPLRKPIDQLPLVEQEAAKQAFRFISLYWIAVLMFVMAVVALAVFDLWATTRFGVQQQKRLFQEHQEILQAELEEHRHRQAEMN
jgi:anaerobic C4-dicarboxylate transporter